MSNLRVAFLAFIFVLAVNSYAQQPTYEQVIVPFDTAVMQGARGARWSAELRVRNSGDVAVNLFPDTCWFIGRPFPCERRIDVQPGVTQVLDVLNFVSPESPGVLLYVPVSRAADLHFSLTVRDLNSQDEVGTTVPIVRASSLASRFSIVGVPVAAGQRGMLRVYDPFLPVNPVFRVRVIDEATNQVVFDREYSPFTFMPSDPPSPALVPATFDFSDALTSPEVLTANRVTVMVERIFPIGLSFWPMISVTSDRYNRFAIFTSN